MAASGMGSSNHGNHLQSGSTLLGSIPVSSRVQSSGDDFTEEDIWSVTDSDNPSDGLVRVSLHDQGVPSMRLNNRIRPEADTNQAQGLAILSSDILSFGQRPAGDIVKPTGVNPVVIPTVHSHLDHLKSRLSQGHHRASAPVNVPDWSKITGRSSKPSHWMANDDPEDDADDAMVPPHELAARNISPTMCFSVHEGVGGTLRGRDLARVRTAILQKTGFIDS
ncbi:hypothetical protein CLOP_g19712 [Closterium sp. NIES-67]|nr:hypothetical protein CLOP_g19712 [Closterium sp. NIES-67]